VAKLARPSEVDEQGAVLWWCCVVWSVGRVVVSALGLQSGRIPTRTSRSCGTVRAAAEAKEQERSNAISRAYSIHSYGSAVLFHNVSVNGRVVCVHPLLCVGSI
jgi:hypothetical protein